MLTGARAETLAHLPEALLLSRLVCWVRVTAAHFHLRTCTIAAFIPPLTLTCQLESQWWAPETRVSLVPREACTHSPPTLKVWLMLAPTNGACETGPLCLSRNQRCCIPPGWHLYSHLKVKIFPYESQSEESRITVSSNA